VQSEIDTDTYERLKKRWFQDFFRTNLDAVLQALELELLQSRCKVPGCAQAQRYARRQPERGASPKTGPWPEAVARILVPPRHRAGRRLPLIMPRLLEHSYQLWAAIQRQQ
jgi:hypothetical protein